MFEGLRSALAAHVVSVEQLLEGTTSVSVHRG